MLEAAPLRRALLRWYRRHARDLPWRRTRDPYRIWLAEVMLQQTRVQTVLGYYERFLAALPDVARLARAPEEKVLKLWEGLGYYSRARNLLRAARAITAAGRFPASRAALERLPGIGRYTAAAISSIAFGEAVPVLDGNVKRVLARLAAIDQPVDASGTTRRLWALAEALLSRRSPGSFNQAMMELGARVCTPRNPRCQACPLRNRCAARAAGREAELPVRRPRRPVPHHEIVAAAIRRNGRYLLGRRPSAGLLGGLWEFPGGKVEPGETHEEALARELREELGLRATVGQRIAAVEHAYSHFRITLTLYRCQARGRPEPRFHTALRWLPPAAFRRHAFPAATLRLLPALAPPPAVAPARRRARAKRGRAPVS